MGSLFNYRDSSPSVKNILLLDSEAGTELLKGLEGPWHPPTFWLHIPPREFIHLTLAPLIYNLWLRPCSEGKRVAVKYYSDDWPTNGAKLAFEKSVFAKTLKTNARLEAEIMMFDSNIVIYKFMQDLHFFVTGGDDENELILATVLQGFFDAVALLLRHNVDKREALENLDLILLCFDEIVDGGMILETDPTVIAGKVATHTMDADAPLSEQTLTQAWAVAREHLTRTLLK